MQVQDTFITVKGNLGKDVEYLNFGEGKTLAKFSLASDNVYYDDRGQAVKETIWHNIVAWGKMADLASLALEKGAFATIKGKVLRREYTDAEGTIRQRTEIKVADFMRWTKREFVQPVAPY